MRVRISSTDWWQGPISGLQCMSFQPISGLQCMSFQPFSLFSLLDRIASRSLVFERRLDQNARTRVVACVAMAASRTG